MNGQMPAHLLPIEVQNHLRLKDWLQNAPKPDNDEMSCCPECGCPFTFTCRAINYVKTPTFEVGQRNYEHALCVLCLITKGKCVPICSPFLDEAKEGKLRGVRVKDHAARCESERKKVPVHPKLT